MSTITQSKTDQFETEARRIFGAVQRSLARVIEAIPETIRRPNDLVHVLGVSKTLAWRIGNLVRQEDPLCILKFLPRDGSVEVFLSAAASKGVPESLLEAVRAALGEIGELAEAHADSRASLEVLVAGYLAADGEDQAALSHRQAAYQSNSFIWGVQAKVRYASVFITPSLQAGMLDHTHCTGFTHFRRLRPNVSWCVGQSGSYDRTANAFIAGSEKPKRVPIDPVESDGICFLRDFCDNPLPELRTGELSTGARKVEVVGGPVGKLGSMTWFLGERFLGLPCDRTDDKSAFHGTIINVRVPCETFVGDLFVHQNLFEGNAPEVGFFGLMDAMGPDYLNFDESKRLPMDLKVALLGRGAAAARSRDVQQAEEIARHVIKRSDWRDGDFNVFRLRVEYPPIPSLAVMKFRV